MRVAGVLLLAAGCLAGQTAGSIRGKVVDAKTSQGVPAAWIMANRTAVPPLSKRTKSGGDGSFQIPGLTAGTYSICVQTANEQYLNPCEWGGVPVKITLSAGQAATGISVRLTPASVLSVQIADAPQALSKLTTDGRHPDLTLGVWGSHGIFYPVHAAGAPPRPAAATQPGQAVVPIGVPGFLLAAAKPAAPTYTYRLAVPLDTALNFSIASHDLNLADTAGIALPANASLQAFQHATGDANPKSFAFSILGLK